MGVLGVQELGNGMNPMGNEGSRALSSALELGLEKGTINHSAYITMLELLSYDAHRLSMA